MTGNGRAQLRLFSSVISSVFLPDVSGVEQIVSDRGLITSRYGLSTA